MRISRVAVANPAISNAAQPQRRNFRFTIELSGETDLIWVTPTWLAVNAAKNGVFTQFLTPQIGVFVAIGRPLGSPGPLFSE